MYHNQQLESPMTVIPVTLVALSPAKIAKAAKRESVHYVNNKEFSLAVLDYVTRVNACKGQYKTVKEAEAAGVQFPRITEYIGRCFLKISDGLSHKPNFIRYTYREEMMMDGVENCIKAIMNYNIDAATRSGKPNAFAYFTQICYFAFLRRIMKEKKQQDIKLRYIEFANIEDFMTNSENGADMSGQENLFVDVLRNRISQVKETDTKIKAFSKKVKTGEVNLETISE